jgi:hypothetical protein
MTTIRFVKQNAGTIEIILTPLGFDAKAKHGQPAAEVGQPGRQNRLLMTE